MEETKPEGERSPHSKRASKPKRKKKAIKLTQKEVNWEKYGILLALAGIIITSVFSLAQWNQMNTQLVQGQTATQQTQYGLTEIRKQNKLVFDQLALAQKQFQYSQKQDSVKDRKDVLHEQETEQRKIVYLHFLIHDSFKTINFFRLSADSARALYNVNPFVIPTLISYSSHSLNSIANEINQEEYYLAALNQLSKKRGGVGVVELFQLCNALHDNYTKAVDSFGSQFPLLVNDKDNYRTSLQELIEEVNRYLLNTDEDKIRGNDKIIFNQVNNIMGQLKRARPNFIGNAWLLNAESMFVLKLNTLLQAEGNPEFRKIYNQTRNAITLRREYLGRIYNVTNALETNKKIQQDILIRMKKVGVVLEIYIEKLNRKQN